MGDPGPYGVLLVDKPAGCTSHDVVDMVRHGLGTKRVGHCGTLDPAATGLLVVTVGPATRLSELLSADDKTYEAVFELGRETTTDDAEGETVARSAVSPEVLSRAGDTLRGMTGAHMLPPPKYSAVKVDGQRAHQAARAGTSVQLQPRPMTVIELRDVRAHAPAGQVLATLRVSKGTYIRSLARELGRRLGVPAHLAQLRRVAAGRARVSDPACLRDFTVTQRPTPAGAKPRVRLRPRGFEEAGRDDLRAQLRPRLLDPRPLLSVPLLEMDGPAWIKLTQGQRVGAPEVGDRLTGTVAVSDPAGTALVVAEVAEGGQLRPRRVIWTRGAPAGEGPKSAQ